MPAEGATFKTVQLVLPQGVDGEMERKVGPTSSESETRSPETRLTETETGSTLQTDPKTPTEPQHPNTTQEDTTTTDPTEPQPLSWKRVFSLTLVVLSSVLYCLSIALAKRTPGVGSPEICCVQCTVCIGILVVCFTHQGIDFVVPRHKVRCACCLMTCKL